jgi:hypothetical protein
MQRFGNCVLIADFVQCRLTENHRSIFLNFLDRFYVLYCTFLHLHSSTSQHQTHLLATDYRFIFHINFEVWRKRPRFGQRLGFGSSSVPCLSGPNLEVQSGSDSVPILMILPFYLLPVVDRSPTTGIYLHLIENYLQELGLMVQTQAKETTRLKTYYSWH